MKPEGAAAALFVGTDEIKGGGVLFQASSPGGRRCREGATQGRTGGGRVGTWAAAAQGKSGSWCLVSRTGGGREREATAAAVQEPSHG